AAELRGAEQLVQGVAEDVPRAERVPGAEVDRAVHLGDDVAVAARQQGDADEVRGRRRGLARAAERDVRPPLARAAARRAAPITRPPATTRRRSQPTGGTSSWASTPWSANHGSC